MSLAKASYAVAPRVEQGQAALAHTAVNCSSVWTLQILLRSHSGFYSLKSDPSALI